MASLDDQLLKQAVQLVQSHGLVVQQKDPLLEYSGAGVLLEKDELLLPCLEAYEEFYEYIKNEIWPWELQQEVLLLLCPIYAHLLLQWQGRASENLQAEYEQARRTRPTTSIKMLNNKSREDFAAKYATPWANFSGVFASQRSVLVAAEGGALMAPEAKRRRMSEGRGQNSTSSLVDENDPLSSNAEGRVSSPRAASSARGEPSSPALLFEHPTEPAYYGRRKSLEPKTAQHSSEDFSVDSVEWWRRIFEREERVRISCSTFAFHLFLQKLKRENWHWLKRNFFRRCYILFTDTEETNKQPRGGAALWHFSEEQERFRQNLIHNEELMVQIDLARHVWHAKGDEVTASGGAAGSSAKGAVEKPPRGRGGGTTSTQQLVPGAVDHQDLLNKQIWSSKNFNEKSRLKVSDFRFPTRYLPKGSQKLKTTLVVTHALDDISAMTWVTPSPRGTIPRGIAAGCNNGVYLWWMQDELSRRNSGVGHTRGKGTVDHTTTSYDGRTAQPHGKTTNNDKLRRLAPFESKDVGDFRDETVHQLFQEPAEFLEHSGPVFDLQTFASNLYVAGRDGISIWTLGSCGGTLKSSSTLLDEDVIMEMEGETGGGPLLHHGAAEEGALFGASTRQHQLYEDHSHHAEHQHHSAGSTHHDPHRRSVLAASLLSAASPLTQSRLTYSLDPAWFGGYLLSGHRGCCYLWDVCQGAEVVRACLLGDGEEAARTDFRSVKFHPTLDFCATGLSGRPTVAFFDLGRSAKMVRLSSVGGTVSAFSFSVCGRYLHCGLVSGDVAMYDIRKGAVLCTEFGVQGGAIHCLETLPYGGHLAGLGGRGRGAVVPGGGGAGARGGSAATSARNVALTEEHGLAAGGAGGLRFFDFSKTAADKYREDMIKVSSSYRTAVGAASMGDWYYHPHGGRHHEHSVLSCRYDHFSGTLLAAGVAY